ncbi:MAG TPA: hypothetical protein VGQ17_18555 [Gemmatimonadales bacterium]|jgi:hypothetical protein|nr:hypothetical protein [Gemmatimonadales bacterium]
MRPAGFLPALPLLLAAAALAACGDPLSLPPASAPNRVDTVTIWAANGTPVFRPSGYDITSRSAVRLDHVAYPVGTFDFAYVIDAGGGHVFLPLALVAATGRTTGNPGFLGTTTPFDSITAAQQVGYTTNDTIRAAAGQVFYVRSAVNSQICPLSIPFYGKLEVLGFDDGQRTVTFRILANVNCGYRGLEVGLPRK